MKNNNFINLLKKGHFVVPLYIFQLKKELKLEIEELVFLIYLTNNKDKFIFNPKEIANDLSYDVSVVMNFISDLCDKNLMEIEVIKNDKGIMEDYINLKLFYKKISNYLIEELNKKDESDNLNLYSIFEKEFGRMLSPMEYEIIKAWISNGYNEEVIVEALKEATFNGVSNLRYIDKILYEWDKKNIKTKEDVFNKGKRKKEEIVNKPKVEVFDYNWFDDEEE